MCCVVCVLSVDDGVSVVLKDPSEVELVGRAVGLPRSTPTKVFLCISIFLNKERLAPF